MMHRLVNPLCLFGLVWGVAATLYLGGVCHGTFPAPHRLTLALVLLNVTTFTLGYLTSTLLGDLAPAPIAPAAPAGRRLTPATAARALKLTLAAGVASLVLEGCRIVAMARHFDTTWLDLVTHPELFRIRLVTFIGENLFQTNGIVMLLSVTSSLLSIGFVLLGVFLYLDRTRAKYVYLAAFLAISLAIGLIHLSRHEVTTNIVYLVFAYCFMSWLDRSEDRVSELTGKVPRRGSSHLPLQTSHLKLAIPFAAVVLLFALIDALLHKSSEFDQPNPLQGWLFHFFWYLASPLAAFNEFVVGFAGDYQWGQNTFFPLYKWLCRFHLAREAEVAIYGEKVLIPYVANTYTYLRSFYEDFGILGVAVVPYVLGWAIAAVRARARRHLQFLNLHLVLLLFILFSFYNYFLVSTQVYLQVLFGFLFFRYRLGGAEPSIDHERYP